MSIVKNPAVSTINQRYRSLRAAARHYSDISKIEQLIAKLNRRQERHLRVAFAFAYQRATLDWLATHKKERVPIARGDLGQPVWVGRKSRRKQARARAKAKRKIGRSPNERVHRWLAHSFMKEVADDKSNT